MVRAGEAYEEAADLYEMDGKGDSSMRKCKEELALILAEQDESLERAASIFCEIAEMCLGKNITKFHAKGFFQKQVLCLLAMGDTVGASEALENAAMQDPRFPQGREGALVQKIVDLCREGGAVEPFQAALSGYNDVTAFSNWEAGILIKVKRQYWQEGDIALDDELAGDADEGGAAAGGDADDDLL